MSYTPTNWVTGDVITADKLNNMENGIVNSSARVFSVGWNEQGNGLDKTWQEIRDATVSGNAVIFSEIEATNSEIKCGPLVLVSNNNNVYTARFFFGGTFTFVDFTCSAANDYPAIS